MSQDSDTPKLPVDPVVDGSDGPGSVFAVVYDELRRLAASALRHERSDHTLQPTALVHEAYLRLADEPTARWENRSHFLAVASRAMRRILVDHARRQLRGKRGGGSVAAPLDESLPAPGSVDGQIDTLHLDRAIQKLEQLDPDQGRIVEMRFFGGLTIEETSAALGISPATVKREWALAKGWLYRELTGTDSRQSRS